LINLAACYKLTTDTHTTV